MELKNKFYILMEEYFKENIVKEIYSNDDFSIMNFGNLFYIGCPFFSAEDNKIFGLMMKSDSVKRVIADNNVFFETIKSFDANTLDKVTVDLSLENLNNLKEYLKKQQIPSKYIDYDFEQEIMNMNKGKSM